MAGGAIEHILTVLTIDEIVNVPGLDLLFIGPGRPRRQHGATPDVSIIRSPADDRAWLQSARRRF